MGNEDGEELEGMRMKTWETAKKIKSKLCWVCHSVTTCLQATDDRGRQLRICRSCFETPIESMEPVLYEDNAKWRKNRKRNS